MPLLVFFVALFVVVDGLNGTGLPDQIHSRLRGVFGGTMTSQFTDLQATNSATRFYRVRSP